MKSVHIIFIRKALLAMLVGLPVVSQAVDPQPPEKKVFEYPGLVQCRAKEEKKCNGEVTKEVPYGYQVCNAELIASFRTVWINNRVQYAAYPAQLNYNDTGDAKRFRAVRLTYNGRGTNNDVTHINFGLRITAIPISATSDDRFMLGCKLVKESQRIFEGDQDPKTGRNP